MAPSSSPCTPMHSATGTGTGVALPVATDGTRSRVRDREEHEIRFVYVSVKVKVDVPGDDRCGRFCLLSYSGFEYGGHDIYVGYLVFFGVV